MQNSRKTRHKTHTTWKSCALWAMWVVIIFLASGCETLGLRLQGQRPAHIEVRGRTLYLEGVLGKVSYHRMKQALRKHPHADTLVLLRSDGSVFDEYNLKTALLIHERGMITRLTPYSRIASGAVDLLLAGKTRVIPQGAKIGVHAWKNGEAEGHLLPKTHQKHQMFLDYYRKVGVDTSFYWFTLAAAPYRQIHWMTEEEIARFELRTY